MSDEIESLIAAERWGEARETIHAALDIEPSSHWLQARLALTYYEQRRYEEALVIARKATQLAPRCPLVLWEVAGALSMLKRHSEAVAVYRRLVRRGVASLALGECGEGMAWARGLVADCWYRMALCHERSNRRKLALRAFEQHLRLRGPGCRSIYPIADVRREQRAMQRT